MRCRRRVKHISAHKGQVNYEPATFDPASKYLYYLTDEASEFTRLKRYALADDRHEDVQKANWDIIFTSFSHNGRYRVTGINEDGRVAISVIETATGRAIPLPSIPQGGLRGARHRAQRIEAGVLRQRRSIPERSPRSGD